MFIDTNAGPGTLNHVHGNQYNAQHLTVHHSTTSQRTLYERAGGTMATKAQKISTKSLDKSDIIIAVMGPTGAGKSTFINTACGSTLTSTGSTLQSVTAEVHAIAIRHGQRRVVFVDTPGLDDTNRSDTDVLKMIAQWLRETYSDAIKLSGIFYLHRISDNRMAGTPLKNLKLFGSLCGTLAADRLVFVTTMWDEVEQDVAESREEQLRRNYWRAMMQHGARVARFDLTYESAWSTVHMVCGDLATVTGSLPSRVLLLQEEMVDLKRKLPQTSAGRVLSDALRSQILQAKQTLVALTIEARKQDNLDMLVSLQKQYDQLEKQSLSMAEQVEELRIPMRQRISLLFGLKRARSAPIQIHHDLK